MNIQFQLALLLSIMGIIFILLGMSYKIPIFLHLDTRFTQSLNNYLFPYRGFFRYIWPLGTNPVAVVLIGICFIPGWIAGILVSIVYIIMSLFEIQIKNNLKRKRPFQGEMSINNYQPTHPIDPSYPSGDAMRAWFLAIILSWIFALNFIGIVISCLVAVLISTGRISLGVHYVFDVIGGSGLGILGAGIALFLKQILFV